MYNQAIDDEEAFRNPAARMGKFNKKKSGKPPINPLTREEVQIMLDKRERISRTTIRSSSVLRDQDHDLRHTFASLLLQQGESPVYVKEQCGHSSIKVTVDTYGHLIPGGNRQAVDRLDDRVTVNEEKKAAV